MSELTTRPLVSVIVPCSRAADCLERCLRSLETQTLPDPFDIIVVDAACNTALGELAGRFGDVRVVGGDETLSPGEARNLGADHATGVILAFLDDDCEAEPDWLENALAGIESGAAMVGGPILGTRPFRPVATADNILSFTDQGVGRPDGRAEYIPACNMAISLADFREAGGFPSAPILPAEDIFFCERVKACRSDGLEFVNLMRIRHAGRGSLDEFCRHQSHFGYYRALLNIRLEPIHRSLGRYAVMIPAVMMKRLLYVKVQALRWNRRGLLVMLFLWPLLLIGLGAWASGFRRGCRENAAERSVGEEAADG